MFPIRGRPPLSAKRGKKQDLNKFDMARNRNGAFWFHACLFPVITSIRVERQIGTKRLIIQAEDTGMRSYRFRARAQLAALAILSPLALATYAQAPPSSNPSSTASPHPHSGRTAGPTPLERLADSYAIYSLLMPGEIFAKMDSSQNRQWAIAQITINAEDINPALAPEAALKAPEHRPEMFREAVADYNLKKLQRSALTRNFNLDRPYTLLTPAEAGEFRAVRGTPFGNSSLQAKYSGYPGLTYFSRVYFDSAGSAALVYMLDWCGNLCAQAEWIYLEKRNGHWVRRSGRTES
jgi:hypothetical protein